MKEEAESAAEDNEEAVDDVERAEGCNQIVGLGCCLDEPVLDSQHYQINMIQPTAVYFSIVWCKLVLYLSIMSVKAASSAALRQEIGSAQQYLCQQLNNYHTLLTETQNQIQNTLAMHLNAVFKQQHKDSNIIAALNEEIARLKDENSFLRNQCMIHSIKEEELQKSRIRILQQNAEKEERVRVLAKEVENIKNSVGSFAGNRENGSIVDFDEEEDCTKDKFEGLEVIREVSEHDLSITMSMQSLHSELIEESSNHRDFQADNEVSPSKTNAGSQESLGA